MRHFSLHRFFAVAALSCVSLAVSAQVATSAPTLGTGGPLDTLPASPLGWLAAVVGPLLVWCWRFAAATGRMREAVRIAVEEAMPEADALRAAAVDGRIDPEEAARLRSAAVDAGLRAAGRLARLYLLGPGTAGRVVEAHVERCRAGVDGAP